jgi:hypothetical protein
MRFSDVELIFPGYKNPEDLTRVLHNGVRIGLKELCPVTHLRLTVRAWEHAHAMRCGVVRCGVTPTFEAQ